MCLAHRFLACLLFMLAVPAWSADAAGWKLEKDKDGIQIYTRAVPGWEIREMRGVTRHAGSLGSLVAAIHDPAAAPELNEFVAKSTIEQRDSETRYRLYTLTKMPWPLTDRDALMQREIVQDAKTRVVTVTDTATDQLMPERKGLVRIIKSRQQWTLTPNADGSVGVELRILSDPRGPIPSSLLNTLSVSTPFKTLSQLKAVAQRAKYTQARLAFIKEGVP